MSGELEAPMARVFSPEAGIPIVQQERETRWSEARFRFAWIRRLTSFGIHAGYKGRLAWPRVRSEVRWSELATGRCYTVGTVAISSVPQTLSVSVVGRPSRQASDLRATGHSEVSLLSGVGR